MLARCVHRSRNVVSTFVLLLLVGLLLVGFLVLTVGSANLSSIHSLHADGSGLPPIPSASTPAMRADGLPPILCPPECPTTTATRADGGGLPPIPSVGPGLATETMAVVN